MIVAWVKVGKGVSGAMVKGPVPGILNRMVSGGAVVALLASSMAWRSEPGPLSLVFVTVNVLGLTMMVTVATLDTVKPCTST